MLPGELIDFYLTRAPHAHADKPDSAKSIDLADFGWTGSKPLNELMQYVVIRHLKADGSSNIFFSAANDVSSKCKEVFGDLSDFSNKECGALLCIKKNLELKDNNTCECKLIEAYSTCLFRHIRNSIAHGNYQINDDSILMLDQASNIAAPKPKYTFVMLTTISFLVEFANLITAAYESFSFTPEDKERLKGLSYRVPRRIVLEMKE